MGEAAAGCGGSGQVRAAPRPGWGGCAPPGARTARTGPRMPGCPELGPWRAGRRRAETPDPVPASAARPGGCHGAVAGGLPPRRPARPRPLPAGAAPPRAGAGVPLALGVPAEEVPPGHPRASSGTHSVLAESVSLPGSPGAGPASRIPVRPRSRSGRGRVPGAAGNRRWETVRPGASVADPRGGRVAGGAAASE